MFNQIPCSLYRGGSSKGAFFLSTDLPQDEAERNEIFQRIMGGNDPKQIDGLGGAQVVTSKVAVVGKSQHEDCDVDYTFVQVYPDKSGVDLSSNCGNISSAVGMFAIEKRLVKALSDKTTVRIFNTNTKKIIEETLPTPGGSPCFEGDYAIAGVPGTGPKIKLAFQDPTGSVTGKLLPTGNITDSISLPDGKVIQVSVVDSTGLFLFVPMEALGLSGKESNSELEKMPELLANLEFIRGSIATLLGFVASPDEAARLSPAIPKIALVGKPTEYQAGNHIITPEKMDLRVCMMTLGLPHKSYAVTGAMCTASAAVIQGSVVNKIFSPPRDNFTIRLANPAGLMEAGIQYSKNGSIKAAISYRTARPLMTGIAYYTTVGE